MDASIEVSAVPEPLGVGKHERLGPNPLIALGLAIVVGVLVFAVLMKMRKTFGMKE